MSFRPAWFDQLDALSRQERVLILLAALAVMLAGWQWLLMDPIADRSRALTNEQRSLDTQIESLGAIAAGIRAEGERDPDGDLRVQIERTRAQIESFEAQIKQYANRMVDPADMPQALKSVLSQFDALEFIALSGLGAVPLTAGNGEEATNASGARRAYRHTFRIEFAGGYLDTIRYLKALEGLSYGIFWDSVELRVPAYPRGIGSVTVFTVSLGEDWIGT